MITMEEAYKTNLQDIKDFSITFDENTVKKISTIFATNFYSDPVYSALREITFNAIDEHIKHNIDKPVIVRIDESKYFPGFEYEASVRDFGKGLTEKQIKEVYTTFFKSTKENSPTQWGKFGLGSKSPFAIHKEFIVKSFLEDRIDTYLMFLVDTPKYTKLKSEENPTGETGLEVIFPVGKHEYYLETILSKLYFNTYPYKVYTYFKSKPVLSKLCVLKSYVKDSHEFWFGDFYDVKAIVSGNEIEINGVHNVRVFVPPKYDMLANRENLTEDSFKKLEQFISKVIKEVQIEEADIWILKLTRPIYVVPDDVDTSLIQSRKLRSRKYADTHIISESKLKHLEKITGVPIPHEPLPSRVLKLWSGSGSKKQTDIEKISVFKRRYKVSINGIEKVSTFKDIYDELKQLMKNRELIYVDASEKFFSTLKEVDEDLYKYVDLCSIIDEGGYIVTNKDIAFTPEFTIFRKYCHIGVWTHPIVPKTLKVLTGPDDKVDTDVYFFGIGVVRFIGAKIKAFRLIDYIRDMKFTHNRLRALDMLLNSDLVDNIKYDKDFNSDPTFDKFAKELKNLIKEQ